MKKSKSSKSNDQQQNGHSLRFRFSKLLDPDATWDKDQLLDVLHWIRQVLGLAFGLIGGAVPLVGAIWIVVYGDKFVDGYHSIMTKKLGLAKYNKQLINKLFNNMAVDKVDYTNFFRLLSNIKADPNIPEDDLLVPIKAVLLDINKERREP